MSDDQRTISLSAFDTLNTRYADLVVHANELRAERDRYRDALARIGGPAGTVVTTLAEADVIARAALRGDSVPPVKPVMTRWEAKQIAGMDETARRERRERLVDEIARLGQEIQPDGYDR